MANILAKETPHLQPILFGEEAEIKKSTDLKIMPVSVLEVKAQKKRKEGNHSHESSRSAYSPFPEDTADVDEAIEAMKEASA